MSTDDIDEYFIYENRLASFHGPQRVTKRRASSAATSRAPKTLSWPHKSIKPSDMAKAGFYFQPYPSNPDNVICFLCNKALDGWEEDDRPLEEHLKHAPECGWAITAAVEAELGEYVREDPRDALMSEARKATFAGRWPHESSKGWTCKTKQLVEAGWKYTPTLESDDHATCTYCHLGLDGWEKGDKPWDEHYSRAPNCPFFALISSKPAPKKTGRSKAARTSKASRLSLQSVATVASDLTSLADVTADIDDSVLTTASTMTTASKGAKKATKGKKGPTTTKTRKTRAKKDEAVEVPEDQPEQEAAPAPPSPAKPARGRKRSSEELEDAVLTNAEAPAPKKRAKTRKARGSTATEASSVDTDMVDAPEPPKKSVVRKARKASDTRKTPGAQLARELSTASADSPGPVAVPSDSEIDRQLEADLERPLSDDEDILADPDIKKKTASRVKVEAKNDYNEDEPLAHTATADFAMFDPAPAEPTDAQVDADLKAMEDEMDVDQKAEAEQMVVPKKGRKAGTRKVSKQTAAKKSEEPALPVLSEQPQSRMDAEAEEPDEIAEADVSFGSNGTVVRKSLGRTSLGRTSLGRTSLGSVVSTTSTKGPAKRGRPPKKPKVSEAVKSEATPTAGPTAATGHTTEPTDVESAPALVPADGTTKRTSTGKRGRPPKNPKPLEVGPEMPPPHQASVEPKPQNIVTDVQVESATVQESFSAAASSPRIARKPVPAPKDSPFAIRKDEPSTSTSTSNVLAVPPKTPRHNASPAQSAKQATISPSPSPQASDAENRPPSSKPNTASSKGKRIPPVSLPTAVTPSRQMSPSKQLSPSKQHAIGSLQSTEPWTAVDLDSVFGGFQNDQEDTHGAADRFFSKGGELTEQERNMTVEEWIYYNAGQAEQKLKFECESMVMAFEKEGTRAIRALEGLVVAE
ncbi:hypothetical protein KVR01_002980 [Diaporthe batatas]|uniref:uncharacterized protein n=1 Tax=Diaporthe batatas TaxID=748121 RepID=UPI001D044671|nr:uncharacterized protein KVR01_002980 [Diaporthe batatas]KAG8167291.1 hypothetical protein KVR01_002980 [Diaporthe batatas]